MFYLYVFSFVVVVVVVFGLLGGKLSLRCVKELWECWILLWNFKLDGLERGFVIRRFVWVEKLWVVLVVVEFFEFIGMYLIDYIV